MSGQAKRSRVRAALRHRTQVARLIMECQWPLLRDVYGLSRAERVAQILDGHTFDVWFARRRAEELIAEGQRAAETWAVFVDWCREQGLGPENREPGSFARQPSPHRLVMGKRAGKTESVRRWSARGGWPGNLAAEWARGPGRVKCDECKGSGRQALSLTVTSCGDGASKTFSAGHQDCPACDGSGLVEGPRPQPGDAQIRMGLRLLAALEGQPSECQVCKGAGGYQASAFTRSTCLTCRGTGHNLAGVLPDIDNAEVLRRRAQDSEAHRSRHGMPDIDDPDDWIERIPNGRGYGCTGAPETRSVPRGQHRALESMDMVAASNRCTTNVSVVNGESLSLWAPVSMLWRHPSPAYEQRLSRCPRWWRSEQAGRFRTRWTIDFPTLLQGVDLDQAAAGAKLVRHHGSESDESLRARLTAYMASMRQGPATLTGIAALVRSMGATTVLVDDRNTDASLPSAHVRVQYTGPLDEDDVRATVWETISAATALDVVRMD